MSAKNGFFAYPALPNDIGTTIEAALKINKEKGGVIRISSWRELDIPGRFISGEVLSAIDASEIFFADVTRLNFNVTYEVGYAIGKGKRVVVTRNKSINQGSPTIREVGIFDTIGYKEYENSESLCKIIREAQSARPLDGNAQLNQKAPVYLLETKHKTDWAGRIVSRIKKSRFIYRNFDPNEQPRLSAMDAIAQVAQSYGVVVPLLASSQEDYLVHNMRGAFIAGLASGMQKALCVLQYGEEDPVPIDYRDFVNVTKHPDDINDVIAEFAGEVADAFQQDRPISRYDSESYLEALDLGASSAENEMRTLENYYLKTDQFLKALRGEANLVVGRKGSGKSAIFLQVRDRERVKKENIVLDLKPDGYKLIKFKEMMLDFLEEGTFQHTIMAFWEYVLLLEICYKILEKDKDLHLNDHSLYEAYQRIAELYRAEGYVAEGDFSERMSTLMERISSDYNSKYDGENLVRLSVPQVTEILYSHDVRKLTDQVSEYMKNKETLWLLFDNIDKGWPTTGLQHEDLIIIRSLIDATKKIQYQLGRKCSVHTIVFLRNDVYELLIKETSDRGKEASVLLDWTDPDMLREIIRLRVVANREGARASSFYDEWSKICVSHYQGEESSQYLVDRSLMRPRFLLNLINHCKSYAINLGHKRIEDTDIEKGLSLYSTDILTDIGYEIGDVIPGAQDVLYAFIDCSRVLDRVSVFEILKDYGVEDGLHERILELLLWYGFLGVQVSTEEGKFIYDFKYNMALMVGFLKKNENEVRFCINPAFIPGLMIN